MKKDTPIEETKELTLIEPQSLDKPEADTKFAQESAKFLVDIIKQNNWSKKLGGQSEHIQYEGWQTAGKYYGYTVKTLDAEYVDYGGVWGFKAKAKVINERTGVEIGGAEALCMSDEKNWQSKPKFQLASMAQTRAGSKALRQILGFVVALAGYSPTPIEEMTGDEYTKPASQPEDQTGVKSGIANNINLANASCFSCKAPSGKPHATNCQRSILSTQPELMPGCSMCGADMKLKEGDKNGKHWKGLFCSSGIKGHPVQWVR